MNPRSPGPEPGIFHLRFMTRDLRPCWTTAPSTIVLGGLQDGRIKPFDYALGNNQHDVAGESLNLGAESARTGGQPSLGVLRVPILPIEVLSDQMLEEDAESASPAIIQLINFCPNQFFRFIGQRNHNFSHGSSRLPKIAENGIIVIPQSTAFHRQRLRIRSRTFAPNPGNANPASPDTCITIRSGSILLRR